MRIETSRLLLMPVQLADATDLCWVVRESVRELSPWMSWAHHGYTLHDAQAFIAYALKTAVEKSDFALTIRRRLDGHLMGMISLRHLKDPEGPLLPCYEVGYWLKTSETKHGYASEAVKGLSHFAFSELKARRVMIDCNSENVASCRVAEKASFNLEARLKYMRVAIKPLADGTFEEVLADTMIYAQVR